MYLAANLAKFRVKPNPTGYVIQHNASRHARGSRDALILFIRMSAAAAKEVLEAVHIEGEGEAQRLVEGRRLGGGQHVGGVEAHHVEREAGARGEVLAVALVFVLVEIAGAEEELVVVAVFGTEADGDFAQLSLNPPGASLNDLKMPVNGDMSSQLARASAYSACPSGVCMS